jgi:hypothetical protein
VCKYNSLKIIGPQYRISSIQSYNDASMDVLSLMYWYKFVVTLNMISLLYNKVLCPVPTSWKTPWRLTRAGYACWSAGPEVVIPALSSPGSDAREVSRCPAPVRH